MYVYVYLYLYKVYRYSRVMLVSGHVAVGLLLDAPVALALLRATRPVVPAGNIYISVYLYPSMYRYIDRVRDRDRDIDR